LHAQTANEQEGFVLPRTVPSLPPDAALKRGLYLDALQQWARAQAVPAELVDAVAFVESTYDPTATGQAGEIGIMQVLPSTAAMLGFRGNRAELAEPETNIRYGVQYLAGALREAGGDLCRALMKYRAGYGEQVMSPRSVEYCRRVRGHLAALGSPLATSGPIPTDAILPAAHVVVAKPNVASARMRRLPPAERSRQFWLAHDARIRALTSAVRTKWARLAQHVSR
jgi:soluble lytic murein transglycosylase-like protein